MIERVQLSDGRVVERQVKSDAQREIVVGRVAALNPPSVRVPGRPHPVRVHARTVGLQVAVNDWVLVARVEQGVVAIAKVEVL